MNGHSGNLEMIVKRIFEGSLKDSVGISEKFPEETLAEEFLKLFLEE